MNEKRPLFSILGVILSLAVGAAGRASAQACYTASGAQLDICSSSENTYYGSAIRHVAEVVIDGHAYAVIGKPNSLAVIDTTNAPQVSVLTTDVPPAWYIDEGNHTYFTDHVKKVAAASGYPYAFVPLYSWGWDWFSIGQAPSFLGTGYHPASSLSTNTYRQSGGMFRVGGNTYLAGARLDSTAGSNIYVYELGDPPPSYANMASARVARLPVGGASDPAPYDSFRVSTSLEYWDYAGKNNKHYLVIRNGGVGVIVDVTSFGIIGGPQGVQYLGSGGYNDARLFEGAWAVDPVRGWLIVGGNQDAIIYDISDPTQPSKVATVPWSSATTSAADAASVAGDLFVCGYGDWLGYINLGGAVPAALPADDDNITFLTRECAAENLGGEIVRDLAVYTQGSNHYVARALNASLDVVSISASCLSTTPKASLTVTAAQVHGTPSCPSSYVKGFPGDTFTVTNTSSGAFTSAALRITPPGGQAQTVQLSATTYSWQAPPAGPTGDWTFDMVLDGGAYDTASTGGTQHVTICADPEAGIAITPSAWLTGDTLSLNSSPPVSEGAPSDYSWLIVGPGGTNPSASGGTPSLTLSQTGTYLAMVVVHWPHAGADDMGSCGGQAQTYPAVTSFLAGAATVGYDACAFTLIDSQAYNVGAITMTQGSNTAGPFLIGQDIALSATYKLSSGWSFSTLRWEVWNNPAGTSAVWQQTGGTTSTAITGTILAQALAQGPYTLKLIVQVRQGTAAPVDVAVAPKDFSISDCVPPGAPQLVSPGDGDRVNTGSVTFTWRPAVGTGPMTYELKRVIIDGQEGVTQCSGSQVTSDGTNYSCTLNLTVAGTYKWNVKASNGCGTTTSLTRSLTIISSNPPPPPPPPPPDCTAPVVSGFTVSPSPAKVGQSVTFTAQASNIDASTTYAWSFSFGLVHGQAAGNPTTYTFAAAGTWTASVTATNGTCTSDAYERDIPVQSACSKSVPTAAFNWTPAQPKVGDRVRFTDNSTNQPDTWEWSFGYSSPVFPGTSTAQNPSFTYPADGTYTVTLVASNCAGSSTPTSAQITVLPQCSETAAPQVDFAWAAVNAAAVAAQYPDQQQPYAGQSIQFTDTSSNHPDQWSWDFHDGGATATIATPLHTFTTAGAKTVHLEAHNCVGGGETTKTVTVYQDQRPVTAEFSIDAGSSSSASATAQSATTTAFSTGGELTFTAKTGFEYGDPVRFVWDFGDGSPTVEGNPARHTYSCRGNYTVTLRAGRPTVPGDPSSTLVWGSGAVPISVDGEFCGPEAMIATGAANLPGLNGTDWHTDVYVFNPAGTASQVWLAALPAGQSTPDPQPVGPWTLFAKGTLLIRDVLAKYFPQYSKAAIRVTYANEGDVPPVVVSRTFTNLATGGTCGQFVPGEPVAREATPSPLWLTGLRNTGLADGFRTNIGLANLLGDTNDVRGLKLTLFDVSGVVRGSRVLDLGPHGYVQKSLENLFGPDVANIGACSLRVELPAGAQVATYYSEVDNRTGDPFLVSGRQAGPGKITVPGVAHNVGEIGTVWRTDVQLTNADQQAHTWELKFFPKEDIPGAFRTLTLGPGRSQLIEDLEPWMYAPLAAPEASGLVCVLPLDDSGVMPTVSARTYNLTPTGTYGQSITPLDSENGASKGGLYSRLYLTGMSSEDIARTNLGFVNIGDSRVEFAAYFYDAQGNMLNPNGEPYVLSLEANDWYQRKLETVFEGFFHSSLGVNLSAISAEILVRSGGPGFAYASTVDSVTGDPIFIPAERAP